jgi:hypothetical protein
MRANRTAECDSRRLEVFPRSLGELVALRAAARVLQGGCHGDPRRDDRVPARLAEGRASSLQLSDAADWERRPHRPDRRWGPDGRGLGIPGSAWCAGKPGGLSVPPRRFERPTNALGNGSG